MSIRTTDERDGYVRIAFEHLDDDGRPTLTTGRLIDAFAWHLDQLSWSALAVEDE